MTEHYNAFISYKHADNDIKVAEAIERGLEHFYVPWGIRKKTGIRKINHIFRDKDELPITSNLTEQISYALDNSDFLIVICSTNTKTSAWVPREIEYFLRTHSRQQILTVLVDGEPFEVIPDILLHEDKTVFDNHGVSHTYRIPLEPLSCDFRSPKRRDRKDELTRLASALLSCSYSELVNRQRQYKVRKAAIAMTFVGLLAFGFSAYMFNSKKKIEAAYTEALINRSRYLASESRNLFENEQRITAMQVALAALPKNEEDDMPETPEAIRALTDATLAYVSESGNNISAAWNYTMSNSVERFIVSDGGNALAARDISGQFTVWDTETHEVKFQKRYQSSEQRGFEFIKDYSLLIVTQSKASVMDIRDGSLIWSYSTEEGDYFADESIIFYDEDKVYLFTSYGVLVLSAETGEELINYRMPGDIIGSVTVGSGVISPDGKKMAFYAMEGYAEYKLYVWEMETGRLVSWKESTEFIRKIKWVDSEKLLVAVLKESVFESNNSFGNQAVLSPDTSDIMCMKASDLSVIWQKEFICNNVMINRDFLFLPAKNAVAFYSGNICEIYDLETGELMYHHNTNESIVDASDRDGDGYPLYITRGGAMALPSPSKGNDTLTLTYSFTDGLTNAVVNRGVYVNKLSSRQIIYYGVSEYDGEWTEADGRVTLQSTDYYMNDRVLAFIYSEEESGPVTLVMYDLKNDARMLSVTLDEEFTEDLTYTFFLCEDNGKLYLTHHDVSLGDRIFSVEVETGRVAQVIDFTGELASIDSDVIVGGKLIILTHNSETFQKLLKVVDPSTGASQEITLPEDFTSYGGISTYPGSKYIVICGEPYLIVDLETGRISRCELPSDWDAPFFNPQKSSGDIFAVSDKASILLYDNEGNSLSVVGCADKSITGFGFYKDDLLVTTDNGYMYRYDSRTGECLGSCDISFLVNYINEIDIFTDEIKGLVLLKNHMTVSVIDAEAWVEIALIDNCFGYSSECDRFFTRAKKNDGYGVGYFRRYTTEELISKAKNILRNQKLTDEQKNEFGITDD